MTQDAQRQDAKPMSCAEFQEQMPELIAAGEDLSSHSHIQSCELCSALLADLESIAEAARQLFPVSEPSDSVWANIQSKLVGDAAPAFAEDAPADLLERLPARADAEAALSVESDLPAQAGLASELA